MPSTWCGWVRVGVGVGPVRARGSRLAVRRAEHLGVVGESLLGIADDDSNVRDPAVLDRAGFGATHAGAPNQGRRTPRTEVVARKREYKREHL